jgi:type IV pilus assembly protein PilB
LRENARAKYCILKANTMDVFDRKIGPLLLEHKKVTEAQLKTLTDRSEKEKKSLKDIVVADNIASEQELYKEYSTKINIPYAEFNAKEIPANLLKLVPEHIAKQYRLIIFGEDKDSHAYLVAMEDPEDVEAIDTLQKLLGTNIRIHVSTRTNINAGIDQYRGNIGSELTKVISEENQPTEEEVAEEDIAEDSPIAQTVNLIIEYAIRSGASDVHIEPREQFVSVRYRVDGILKEVNRLPKKIMAALISRIKILSNLKIDERRVPQDGRLKIAIGDKSWSLRVSTLPIMEGEKVVMRVLNDAAKAQTLEQLGYWGQALSTINDAMSQPHGMILVTGPTGSGKSTSLFSVLSILNSPTVNISTVEDPVEYHVQGVNQTQVNPKAGMTFANGLRALLRQDPNIIMVGEIRDAETAGLAVQAALTGHLVLSTLHTNNAATSLPRLLDMGIEPFLIASTVRAVIGQRLVRRLCIVCREQFKPDETQLKGISEMFKLDDPKVMAHYHELEKKALEGGVGKSEDEEENKLATTEKGIEYLWRPHKGGCDACNHNSYKGRIGIYEALPNSEEIQSLIVSNSTSEKIQDTASAAGMITMQMDGFIKALRGLTAVEEILRVTRE